MGRNREARRALENFDGWLVRRIGGSHYALNISRGEIGSLRTGEVEAGRNDLLLEGDTDIFRDVFEGRVSPGLAFNFGFLHTPGGKARENLICAVFMAMRANQTPPERDLLAEVSSEVETNIIRCQICGFQTGDRNTLAEHMLNHISRVD